MSWKRLSVIFALSCLLTGCSPYQVRVSLRDQRGEPVDAKVVATNSGYYMDILSTHHDTSSTGNDGTCTLSWIGAEFPGKLQVRGRIRERKTPEGRVILGFVSRFDVDQIPFVSDWAAIELQSRHLDVPGEPYVESYSDDTWLEMRVEVTER